jgi:D-galactarolactone cycloisomerase
MIIKKIQPITVKIPFNNKDNKIKFHNSDLNILEVNLIRIETEEGIVGWGESFSYTSWKSVRIIIEDIITPLLIGKKIQETSDITKLMKELQFKLHTFGRYGITMFALSGVEIGLWDSLGKEKKLPIYKMLGKIQKNKFKAYASLIRYSDKNNIEKYCKDALDHGFEAIKLHEKECKYIEIARKFLGEKVILMNDANCSWTFNETIKFKKFFEANKLFWIEEPIFPPEDFKKLSMLKKHLKTPIAIGENACTKWEFEKILEQGAASFIQPSVTKVGGISEFNNIIQLSDKYNIPIMPHSAYFGPGFISTLHLASQFKQDTYIERFYLDLYEEFYPEFNKTNDGFYLLPDSPGLGVDFNEDIIKKYKI